MTTALGYTPSRYLDAPSPSSEQISRLRALLGLHLPTATAVTPVTPLRPRIPAQRTAAA